jgi:hypothetical protein
MRFTNYLSGALLAASTLAGGTATAANICQADKLTCPTTMPVGGYCECKAHGDTQGGTVVAKHAPHPPVNATGAGCGAHPGAPGCP